MSIYQAKESTKATAEIGDIMMYSNVFQIEEENRRLCFKTT